MSKLNRAEAARINGAKSRGPVTPEGKARSSKNAIRHSLAADSIPLTNESRERFLAMLEAYSERFQPADIVEEDLVEELVTARWLQRRALGFYNAAIDLQMSKDKAEVEATFNRLDGEIRQIFSMKKMSHDDPHLLVTLHRYEVSASRKYYKALNTLRDLQADRFAAEDFDPDPTPNPGPQLVPNAKLQNEPKEPPPGKIPQVILQNEPEDW